MSEQEERLLEHLRWVIAASDGVAGLRADGRTMEWPQVLRLYVPAWTDASVVALLLEAGTAEYFAEQLVLLRDHPPVATEITRRLAAP